MGKVLRFGAGGVIEESSEMTQAAGAPAPQVSDPVALAEQLSILGQNALIAHNRLTNLVDPTKAPAGVVQALIERYAVLQSRLAALFTRVQALTPESTTDAANVVRDGQTVGTEVQAYIESVEGLVGKYPRGSGGSDAPVTGGELPSTTLQPKRSLMPWVLLGGMAILIAGGGYLIWAQKQKQDKAQVRRTRKAFAAIPARGGKR